MAVKLNMDRLNKLGCGFDLGDLARKIQTLGDMIQAVHQSKYPEMGFDSEGTIGSIVADYGRLVEVAADDLEGEVECSHEIHKGSRIRLFSNQFEQIKAGWVKDNPMDKRSASLLLEDVDSYLEQHNPVSLYNIRAELLAFLGMTGLS